MPPIAWIPVEKDTPEQGERVMVKNAIHCWDTTWRHCLADRKLPTPVLMWSRDEIPTLLERAGQVDPESVTQQIRVAKR
jgi:hypothetical protein